MKIEVNGEWCEVAAEPDDTAVELLRDRLGLTGTKLVCGSGACGACTVGLDGEPVVSCLLPVSALEGRSVSTVEGLSGSGHPVLRAFVAHAALQCGFCTPGFVVEAVAFHDRWRAAQGTAVPTDEQVAAELAGHLCRCGAYREIQAAVRDACAGRFDAAGPAGPRHEGRAKVSGRARYTVDVVHDGQLEGVVLRSPHPHARIVGVDLSGALSMPGVVAAVSLLDGAGIVRYVGQEVAAVAATDRRTAHAALDRIVVDYDVLPAVIGMAAARAAGAALVYEPDDRNPPSAGEQPDPSVTWSGNVRGPDALYALRPQRAARLIGKARRGGDPLLVEGVYQTSAQLHTAFEPHAAVARFLDDTLEVHISTQAVCGVAAKIAARFGLSSDRVRVLAEHVGGGFGAKLDLSPETVAAVSLAQQAGAPVRVVLDRAEELSATGYRPPARMELSLLANRRGRLVALRLRSHADAGIAIANSIAGPARWIYPARAKELLDYDVVTNKAPGCYFRAPGGPVLSFALEQAVDEAARRLGRDPIELRRRWDSHRARQRLYRWAARLPAWRERDALARTGRFRRGVGVAAATWFYMHNTDCEVALSVAHGQLTVATAVQDMGTGSRSVLAATVAAVFGLRPADVEVRLGDSTLPRGPQSGGSQTTATIAPAALAAAEQLKSALLAPTVARLSLTGARCTTEGIRYTGGCLSWPEVLAGAPPVRVTGGRPEDNRLRGWLAPRPLTEAGRPGVNLARMLRSTTTTRLGRGETGAVHVVEVEVDTRLGRTRVLRAHCGHAVGRLAVPVLAAAQAHGGIIQGIGYALYEQRELDPDTGRVLSAGLEDYRIPGIGDVPEIDLHFDPGGFAHVPGGGVGLAEVTTIPVAAAIANAVYDATGVRQYHLPILPERLLASLTSGGVA
ncbi:MAG: molybdopterin-dependent oxidoreductase [Labedaea sp.]